MGGDQVVPGAARDVVNHPGFHSHQLDPRIASDKQRSPTPPENEDFICLVVTFDHAQIGRIKGRSPVQHC